MTFEIAALLLLLVVMVFLFLTEKLPVDLTAFLGLVALVFAGYVEPDEAFSGFASSAVITMLSIFIVSAALLYTGVADWLGGRMYAVVGGREIPLIVALMIAAGILSAFMNNIAATAVLMPAVASLARRAELPPSKLFMPLAFGAILGGTTTLVGTPPNIVAAAMMRDRGLVPFGLFDFTPIGLAILGLGVVFMITAGRRLLPKREMTDARSAARRLAQVYKLRRSLFSIRIPDGSSLDGLTLGQIQLGSTLAVNVVAILRGGRRDLAPEAATVVRGGDVLLVEGKLEDLRELLRVQGVQVEKTAPEELPRPKRGVSGVRVALPDGSALLGKTLREVKFRERFGLVAVGIQRDGSVIRQELASLRLSPGDEILALGTRSQIQQISANPEFTVREVGLTAVRQPQEGLYVIRIPDTSPLVGATVGGARIGELVGLTVGGIIREEEILLAVAPEERLQAGDQLLIAGEPNRILQLLELGEVQVNGEVEEPALESEKVGVAEATLAPRSSVAGHTLRELDFRDRYGVQILAIWREGQSISGSLANQMLRFGDALLLQGPRERIRRLASDSDFLVLSGAPEIPRRTRKAPYALGALLLMVGLVVFGIQPIQVAAFTAAAAALLSGALTMEEAYRAIEWKAIFLVAAVLPVGLAMERSQAAPLLAETVSSLAGPFGPFAILAAMAALSSLLSQGLDGAPAVVLLTPVVLETAAKLGLSPYPLMMAVSLAASAAFMTPFSHKANLLVMGAGGYRASDYLKVGTPLTLVLLVVLTLLVPVFFPF